MILRWRVKTQNKGNTANEFVHCVPPGAIRRDERENQSTLDILDFGIE